MYYELLGCWTPSQEFLGFSYNICSIPVSILAPSPMSKMFVFVCVHIFLQTMTLLRKPEFSFFPTSSPSLTNEPLSSFPTSSSSSSPPSSSNCSVPDSSSPPYNFYAVLLVLLIFCVVFGNVLVCVAVWGERTLQTTTNYLIVSLAVSDLLLATLVMPWGVYLEVRRRTASMRDSFNCVSLATGGLEVNIKIEVWLMYVLQM